MYGFVSASSHVSLAGDYFLSGEILLLRAIFMGVAWLCTTVACRRFSLRLPHVHTPLTVEIEEYTYVCVCLCVCVFVCDHILWDKLPNNAFLIFVQNIKTPFSLSMCIADTEFHEYKFKDCACWHCMRARNLQTLYS